MTITLPNDVEERLREQARRAGMDPESYLAELVTRLVTASAGVSTLAELFDQLRMEQWTDDQTEIDRRAREESEFMEAMSRNRLEMDGPGARQVYP